MAMTPGAATSSRRTYAFGMGFAFRRMIGVMGAVILRDMRTRFDVGNGLGFALAVAWPLAHMGILLVIYNATGRATPYGDSLDLFFATGIAPALGFAYVSRNMAFSVNLNRPMLSFPVVRVPDILYGRAILEIIGITLTVLLLMIFLTIAGDSVMPVNVEQAILGMASTIVAAVGTGTLIGSIALYFPVVAIIYALITILLYVCSGVFFIASNLPQQYQDILAWVPTVHAVEWVRTAYYPDYPAQILDKMYLLEYGLTCLCLGLAIERFFRPFAK
jgi:capsular polysaccharide transport system permease protein